MSEIIISVPVKPASKKFLQKNFILSPPYRLSSTDPVGALLLGLLKPKSKFPMSKYHPEECIDVKIGNWKERQLRCFLNEQGIVLFCRFVQKLMEFELHKFLDVYQEYGGKITEGILSFRKKYEISEDEWAMETMRKGYTRYQKYALAGKGGFGYRDYKSKSA